LFGCAKNIFFAVIFVAMQLSLIKANYASEIASKKCSNSVADSVIFHSALSGDVEAQYFLGNKLFSPSCTSDEQEKGLALLMRAAQGDHPNALFILGYMIFENAQNDKEVDDALRYLERSSRLGHHPAKSYLGSVLLHNATTNKEKLKALDLLKTAALAGSKDAAKTLYHIYSSGLYGETKSLCIADFWFAFTFKKDKFISNSPEAEVSDCRNGEQITILE
tara:strand:+ start:509 stop:1171 length:663 start_codon:yes stop_codon:yes gene_type:complete